MTYTKIFNYRIAALLFTGLLLVISTVACSNSGSEKGSSSNSAATEVHDDDHGKEASVATLTSEQIQAVGVTIGKLEQKSLTATLSATGYLKVPNSNKAIITSMFGGIIQTLNVEVGTMVRKGQVVATIAHPQLIQLQEEYLTLNNRITFAEREQQRQKELYEGNVGALKNLQGAETELASLRVRRASVQQQIRLMGIDPKTVSNENLLSEVKVVSPITGKISAVYGKIGTYTDVASPVAEVVDNSSLHLDLNVFEKDLSLLKVGQLVNFTVTNNPQRTYTAKVSSISSSFANDSKTVPVHCEVSGDKSGLIDGTNVTGVVSLTNVLSLAVPSEAIVDEEGKSYIFLVRNNLSASTTHSDGDTHDDKPVNKERAVSDKHEKKTTVSGSTNNGEAISFERVEVVRGVSQVGYTAITPIPEIPADAIIATKGAFFINAQISGEGGHAH